MHTLAILLHSSCRHGAYCICRCVILQLLRPGSAFRYSAFKSHVTNPHMPPPRTHTSVTSAFQQRSLHSAGPWRVPCAPSPLPPSPALLQRLSPPMIAHHRARCVQLPLAGINIRHPQPRAAHAETKSS